jgi:hypothetical protein
VRLEATLLAYPEAVKKLLQIRVAGRDIEKVLQRYLFG